jgi:hypothetical protein
MFGRWLDLKLLQIVLDGPLQPTDSCVPTSLPLLLDGRPVGLRYHRK